MYFVWFLCGGFGLGFINLECMVGIWVGDVLVWISGCGFMCVFDIFVGNLVDKVVFEMLKVECVVF